MIATDDSQLKEKEQADGESRVERKRSRKHARKKMDSEFGVVRGIDFKNVNTVCSCFRGINVPLQFWIAVILLPYPIWVNFVTTELFNY